MLALMGMNTHAAIYIVGDCFGGWDPANGVEMTLDDNGLYTYTTTINGTVYFVFADGLDSDFTTFNNNYRYGPVDGNMTVNDYDWYATQKSSSQDVYQFNGAGSEYVFIFDETNKRFKIEAMMTPPFYCFTVAGTSNLCGSSWDPTDETNDMVRRNDGIFVWNKSDVELSAGEMVEFKIVENHSWDYSWPDWSYCFTVDHAGLYDITITFNPVDKQITCQYSCTTVEPVFGDVNKDGVVNISDVTFLIDCILGDKQNMDCDINQDGTVNISDISILIDLIISGHRTIS